MTAEEKQLALLKLATRKYEKLTGKKIVPDEYLED